MREIEALSAMREEERLFGIHELGTYQVLNEKVRQIKSSILSFLIDARQNNKQVIGYGAPAKGNTLLNYCGIKPDLLPCVVDRNPYKQGKYLPGSLIPIKAPERIRIEKPDYVWILPWNIKEEVEEEMAIVREWGGQFITAIPQLEVW
jgi:C-methyltransferase C-terminal domain